MSFKHLTFAAAALATALWLIPKTQLCAQEAPAPGQDQEVLTHGPVHEAFAEPTEANPGAPLIVPKMPAAPIEELPPDVKPDGANVVWVSGYWAWDDTRRDFIWVSGIWRDTPPGYVWVAGYWNQVADGAQWTPGFWSPEKQEQVNYLPEPPQTLETGPNIPQTKEDTFWIPGNYQYVDTRYVWRTGYWAEAKPDWIWTPAHFIWTPSGYIFIPGHWDYALARRGVLFAPVYFAGPVYLRRNFVYGPSVVIDSNLLTVNFFVRPNYHHYYFGDYYGENFVSLGFTPWFSVGVRTGYDPLFTYYRWDHRNDRHWQEGLREHYTYMNAHPEARPPRTFVQQNTIINNNITIRNSNTKNIAIGAPLNQYVKSNGGGSNTKFVAVSNVQRQQIAQQAVKSQDFTRERAKFEASPSGARAGGVTGGPSLGGQPKTMNLHTMAQSSGGLPGATGAIGRTTTGPSGPATAHTGPGTTGPSTTSGTTTGRGPITTTGPATGGPATSGPATGRGPASTGGSDPFKLKSGESIKSGGPTGPTGPGPTSSGSTGKTGDPSKGPSSGSRTPSGPAPSDTRGRTPSGDPRGKKPDDKSGATGPGNGRLLFTPGNSEPATTGRTAASGEGESGGTRAKDPIRPLTLDPGMRAAANNAASEPKRREVLYPPSSGPQNQPRAAGGGNGPVNKNDPDPRAKDPIKPLKLIPTGP